MADISFVELTPSSLARSTARPSNRPSVPVTSNAVRPTARYIMSSRSFELQKYIGAHFGQLKGADRKKAKEIIRRGNFGEERKLDLGQLPVEHLEELFRHVLEVVKRGTVPSQTGESKHPVRPKVESREDSRIPDQAQLDQERRHREERVRKEGQEQEQRRIARERVRQMHATSVQGAQGANSQRQQPATNAHAPRPSQQQAQIPNKPLQQSSANLPIPRLDQLRNIIMTADVLAIRDVFLNLCYSSPSLGRAAIRCLAPHSTFAQATLQQARAAAVTQQPPKSAPQPQIKHEFRLPKESSPRNRPSFKVPEVPQINPVKQEKGTQAPNTMPKRSTPYPSALVESEHATSPSLGQQRSVRQPLSLKSANIPSRVNPEASTSSLSQKRKVEDENTHIGQ
ncbi:uncharacterized protein BDZ99DRAFT_110486 [Mytilinidion resinicola]|uniref:Uncharacterized protein n=1 Tax=Mytilinidion resinicola TaxID=574789 RepID=A0A6A6YAT4_9PEZI|nr:uncharacterized protein BDZ99DRAFT_110486 [Mytilinidion resinicola]KAF2805729.1 hypothetical protein BDZ99DRAFT_110486 [Mytilinidion resinicola]